MKINKFLRKVVCMSLVVAVMLPIGTGCSKKEDIKQAEAPAPVTEEKKEGPSWTWDTSPVELSVFVAEGGFDKQWDAANNPFDKMVTEETGVSLKLSSGDGNKLNALIASGDLPDIIVMWTGYTQRSMLEEEDRLYALDDLIKDYAPTFTNIPTSMMNWFKNTKKDKTYAIANYFYTPEHLTEDVYLSSHNRITARKDIMDELGIKPEDFSTKDGFVEALKKVKDSKTMYNGFEVTPLLLGAAIPRQSVEFLANYMGVNYEDGKTGKWLDYRKEPETLEALLFANRLYTEGLLSVESLTIDNKQLEEKVASGSTFATTGFVGSQAEALTQTDPNAYMVPIGPVKGDNGKEPYLRSTTGSGWLSTVITKNCKTPDRAIRFLEYLMTPEKMVEATLGVEGVVWTPGAEGRIEYTEQFLADKAADPQGVNKKYGIDEIMFTRNDMIVQPYLPLPTDPVDINLLELDKAYGKYTYSSIAFDELAPDGGTNEASIDARLNQIWDQAIGTIITAASPEDAEAAYKKAIADLDKEGWDAWYATQDAKFQERKAKLGLEFAHPYNQ